MSEAFTYVEPGETLGLLSERFDKHGTIDRGSTTLIHITGEQAVSRLNEVLGAENWDFKIVDKGSTPVEYWVIGELTVRWPNGAVSVKHHVGNQDLARGQSMSSDVLKAAATDALKKCASLIGVGLYLFDAEQRSEVQSQMGIQPRSGGYQQQQQQRQPAQFAPRQQVQSQAGPAPACFYCSGPIEGTQFQDGKVVSAEQVVGWGMKNFNVPLCLRDYSAAKKGNIIIDSGQPDLEEAPF